MGSTPVVTIDQTGAHRPDFATILSYFTSGYATIYGSDIELGSDTEDGELLGLFATAVDDCNQEAISAYSAYSPATAQGSGLASNVKINGLKKFVPSNSTIPVSVGGTANLTILNGLMNDDAGNQWTLPSSVTIPSVGAITVTATCLTPGAIQLASASPLTPVNPTRGWQTVTAVADATPGAPAELDAQLRIRQSLSTALPSSTMLDGIQAAILSVPGVVTASFRLYENDGDALDVNGVPGHSIAAVVEGGDATAIAEAIQGSKFAAGTFGTTSETIIDAIGVSHVINFFFLAKPPITWVVNLTPGPQFSTNTIALIQASMAGWTNQVGRGVGAAPDATTRSVQLSRAWTAAYLGPSISATVAAFQAAVASGDTASQAALATQLTMLNQTATTYEVTSLLVARDGGIPAAADVPIAFNESAFIAVNTDGSPVDPASVVVNI